MNLGSKCEFLVEFLSHIDANGRVIVLADLAELGHNYQAGDILRTYRGLKSICESWDIDEFDEFKLNIYEFVDEQYKRIRSKLGANAMEMIRVIEEESDDDERQRKNKEEFEKEAEKRKKGEQTPIAKAVRSKGETQTDMADNIDLHKSTISRIKTGSRNPSFDTLKKLGKRYGKGFVNQLLGT